MLSPQLRLIVALALALSSLTFLAVTLNAANTRETTEAAVPLTAKILRRKDKLKEKLDPAEEAELRRQALGQEVTDERQLEDTTPKHVPIKVKIKAEKEKEFKDLTNDNWLRDLELEVTNTGKKPIYFLALGLSLPETRGPDGNLIGWPLLYGRNELISIDAALKPQDVAIQPGERYVFKIADRFVRGWASLAKDHSIPKPKKAQIIFQFINFGDGTGYWGGTAAPLPHPKRITGIRDCYEGNAERKYPGPLLARNSTHPSNGSKTCRLFCRQNFCPTNFHHSDLI